MRLFILILGTSLFLIPGCGGGGGGGGGSSSGGQNPGAIVSPSTVSLAPSAHQQFSATIPNVVFAIFTWSVQEGAAGGSVNSSGYYTAPPTAGVYHVVATGGNVMGTATVTVHPTITVSPPTSTTTLGKTEAFTADVVGTPDTAVTWKVEEGNNGGTITPAGVYSPVMAGTFHIIATSVADPSQSATATVTVQVGSATGTIQ